MIRILTRLAIAAVLVAPVASASAGSRDMYPARFSAPQGKTCSAKCRNHVAETHESLQACLKRHCSPDSSEHW